MCGTRARARIDLYTGTTRVPEHCSWLQCVLARHALVAITTNGSPLREQKLAAAMKEHVHGVLGQLHEVDAVPDRVQKEDPDTV